ncbi:MAG: phage tail sheath subtilisin-like domain-containing protein [Magnetovibrionaceae bacterium]
MAIAIDAIPDNLRVPGAYIEIDQTGAFKGLPGMPSRILVIGQRLATGTVLAGVPTPVLDERAAEAAFGRGSMLHLMIRALKANNNFTECWAVALDDDGAAAAATGSLTFAGSPTQSGTVNLMIAGQRVRVAAIAGASAADIATLAEAAINTATDLPVTANVAGGTPTVVDLTARNKGLAGNGIDLRHSYYQGEALPAGLTLTIDTMADGTANPVITPAIDAVADEWFTDWAMPYTDPANLIALETELDNRFGPLVMMDGHAYLAATDTHANLTTLGNSRNSPHRPILGLYGSPSWAPAIASALCGVTAFYARQDPAEPFQTLELKGVLPPLMADRFDLAERNLLLHDGISTVRVDDGGAVRIERLITGYQTNSAGAEDPSFLDMNTMKTVSYIRYAVRARIAQKFPRYKLAPDGTLFAAGQRVVTPKIIRAELISLFRQLENIGLVHDLNQFIKDLIVEIDPNDPNRVNALIPPNLVNQLRVFAGRVAFLL